MKYEIAGVTYNVEEVNGLTDAEHFGYINFADSVIRIDANLSEDRKRQTLAHELAHALLYEAGFEDHDEELASRLGRVLHMFFRDNDFGYFRGEELTGDEEHTKKIVIGACAKRLSQLHQYLQDQGENPESEESEAVKRAQKEYDILYGMLSEYMRHNYEQEEAAETE